MCARISNSPNPPTSSSDATAADAHGELEALADELRRATLEVAWRQWRAFGAGTAVRANVSGARDGARDLQTLIDPEALVLVSLGLVHEERRLADLLHDWAERNAELLSIQRVKNLLEHYPASVRSTLVGPLAWFATVACDAKDLRWRSVAQAWSEEARRGSSPMDGTMPAAMGPGEYVRSAHPGGGAAGRGSQLSTKSRATRARLTARATLVLRLRLGFGVGVKADLLAFLLARAEQWATVRDVAHATAYTPAAVRRAAEDLAAARLVQVRESQPTSFRVPYAAWAPLLTLEDGPPRWGSWHERFVFTAAFLQWAASARERPLSQYVLGAQGRELLEQHRPAFERDHLAVWSAHTPIQDWAVFLRQAIQSLAEWMREMA